MFINDHCDDKIIRWYRMIIPRLHVNIFVFCLSLGWRLPLWTSWYNPSGGEYQRRIWTNFTIIWQTCDLESFRPRALFLEQDMLKHLQNMKSHIILIYAFNTFMFIHPQPKAGPMDTFWLIGPSGDTGEYALMSSMHCIAMMAQALVKGYDIGIGIVLCLPSNPKCAYYPIQLSGDSPRASNSAVTVGAPRIRED